MQQIQRFYSRDDRGSLDILNSIFNLKGTFFIENTETHFWVQEITPMGPVMTIDPLKALLFTTRGEAMTFRVKNNLCGAEWETTEHDFF